MLNQDYCDTLFNLMDKDKSGKISVYIRYNSRQEFVTTYIVLEEKIRFKQIRLKKAFDEIGKTKEKYQKAMIENQNEKVNREGIADNAVLNITVLEAKELKPLDFGGNSDPYVQLILEGKKEKSTYKPGTLDPVWNEDFVMSVKSKESVLRVEIYDKDMIGDDDLEGIVEIPMVSLLNQQKVDNWYELENEKGEMEKGKIRLKLQLIWSRHQYFQDNLNKTYDKLEKIKKDMDELNKFLELFDKPFGILLYVEIDDRVSKIMWGDTDELLPPQTISRMTHISNKAPKNFANTLTNVFRGTFSKFLIK